MKNGTHFVPEKIFYNYAAISCYKMHSLTNWRNSALKRTEMLIMAIVFRSAGNLHVIRFLIHLRSLSCAVVCCGINFNQIDPIKLMVIKQGAEYDCLCNCSYLDIVCWC